MEPFTSQYFGFGAAASTSVADAMVILATPRALSAATVQSVAEAGAAALTQVARAQLQHFPDQGARQPAAAGVPLPVVTPDIADLPFTMDNSVKVFHLIAEPVKQVILPGRTFDLWGFNGSAPGPTIQAKEGDRIRIVFDNHLPEPTGIHWHGLELPIEMDGVPGIGMKPVMPGGRFVYEFSLHQNGTFFYHSHMAMQEMVGMLGGFVIHPRMAYSPRVDKEYLFALQEYAVLPNSTIPNSVSMEFNWLTFNGKAGPASTPLIIKHGERVRIRIINLGMDHHPIHLHGFTFWETGWEGARQPEAIWPRGNTTLVGVAQARDIEFAADRVGGLDVPLPSSASHDEPDGLQCRAHDADRPRHAARRKHGRSHGNAAGWSRNSR